MKVEALLKSAIEAHRKGLLKSADRLYQDVLGVVPNHPDALHLSGLVAYQSGNPGRAERKIRQAIQGDPRQGVFYCNLGNILVDQGDHDEAAAAFQKAIELNPVLFEAHYNLGNLLIKNHQFEKAVSCLKKAISVRPKSAGAWNNLGIALERTGKLEAAAESFERAIQQQPDFFEAYRHLGDTFWKQSQPETALSQYRKAISLKPNHIEAHMNMGNVFHALGHLEEAAGCYQTVLQIDSRHVDAHANLGKTLVDQGKLDEAVSCYRQALSIKPEDGNLTFDLSTVLLLQGKFKKGWEGYDRRFERRGWERTYPYRFDIPRWDGSPFPGKRLFVHCEQGFGDVLQFARYLPMVKARGGEVIFEVPKPLMRLMENFAGTDIVIEGPSKHNMSTQCDFYAPLLSLPGLFGTTLENIPCSVPYLHSDPEKASLWRKNFSGKGIQVGLVWEGKATDPNRSCPVEQFEPLGEIQGVRWFGLQKGKAADRALHLTEKMELVNLGEAFDDFSDTAAAIACLDLVISIDTAVAHLAGAMGKPVWVLLKSTPDWRWLMDREDSPWYPTMRLFRQTRYGEWEYPVRCVVRELKRMVHHAALRTS